MFIASLTLLGDNLMANFLWLLQSSSPSCTTPLGGRVVLWMDLLESGLTTLHFDQL